MMSPHLVLDVETNILNKGNPFSKGGKLVLVGLGDYIGLDRESIQKTINSTNLLVGFNIKFDLHWIRKHEINFSHCSVWDCQLAEFLLGGQREPYPSLDSVAGRYQLGSKCSNVSEYWDNGVDTENIPKEVLLQYLKQDLLLTEQVYLKQKEQLEKDPQLYNLFKLQCLDLLVLQDMEYNGMTFDIKEAERLAIEEETKQKEIEQQLMEGYENIPINFQSRDHLSSYIYGGIITDEVPMPVGHYKTGARAGEIKYKKMEFKYELPQLVEPPKGSELKKEGFYATDEGTLRSIRCNKQSRRRINGLLERSKSCKLVGTYYRGIPELIEKMDWPDGKIHGQFNQCVAATGRLSSSKPNLQNFAGEVDKLLRSRYD